jgi:hypothetical protein
LLAVTFHAGIGLFIASTKELWEDDFAPLRQVFL